MLRRWYCEVSEIKDNCPIDCAETTNPPELNNFGLSADTINTSINGVAVIYNFSATAYDNYLSSYTIRANSKWRTN